jgi:hypothetical protein
MVIGPDHEPKNHKNLEANIFRAIFGLKAGKSYGINIGKSDDSRTMYCTNYFALQVRYTKTI